jgi:hypothetical protein
MLDIYAHQGAAKAIQTIKLNTTQNLTGKLFRITYLWWQYEIGTKNCPFELKENKINIDYSNSTWFTELFKKCPYTSCPSGHPHSQNTIDISWTLYKNKSLIKQSMLTISPCLDNIGYHQPNWYTLRHIFLLLGGSKTNEHLVGYNQPSKA